MKCNPILAGVQKVQPYRISIRLNPACVFASLHISTCKRDMLAAFSFHDHMTILQIYMMTLLNNILQFICFSLWLLLLSLLSIAPFLCIIMWFSFNRRFEISKEESCKGNVNSTVHILCCQNNIPRSDLLALAFFFCRDHSHNFLVLTNFFEQHMHWE